MPKRMLEITNRLREQTLIPYDLPDRFHLSESPGKRLAAIIALEQQPNPDYFRWLAERVIVERQVLAVAAGFALVAAALRLKPEIFPRLRVVVQESMTQLDGMKGYGERVIPLRDANDAVKYREGDTPKPWGLPYDELAQAFIDAFDLDSLKSLLWPDLQVELRRIARLDSRIEYIVFRILSSSAANGWDGDLMKTAPRRQPKNEILAEACRRYPVETAIA